MNRIGIAVGAAGVAGMVGTWALGCSLRGEGEHDGLAAPLHDFVRGVGGELRVVQGAGTEALNVLGHHVHLPFSPKGTIYEPHGRMQHAGADAIDAVGRFVGLVPDAHDPAANRDLRPLLARQTVQLADAGPATLTFSATSTANWGTRGRESVLAAIYVDGEYVSDMPLLGERDEPYRVLLGELAAGSHEIEVRIAEGSPLDSGRAASIAQLRVAPSRQPLVDRYAPIIEGRDLGRAGGQPELGFTDAPLVLSPVVTRRRDGTTRIDYHMLYSNEDGGTATGDLMHKYGRITDYEPIYTVLVDERGERISDSFQTSRHNWMAFDGERVGDRPLMRIGTDNNLMTARVRHDGHRWTGAPEPARAAGVGARTIMNEHPWTWAVMGRELVREGKQTSLGRLDQNPVNGDPRDFLYVAMAERGNVLERADQLRLVLSDGSHVQITDQELDDDGVTPVTLPDGVEPASIVRIEGVASGAYILDTHFQPIEIDVAQPLPQLEKPADSVGSPTDP